MSDPLPESSYYSPVSSSLHDVPESYYNLLYRIMDRIKTAIQETTGRVPIGPLVTMPRHLSNQVGILADEGFDSITFSNAQVYHYGLAILPDEGKIFVETHSRFRSNEKTHQENILLYNQSLTDRLTQLEGLLLIQGYVSYGYLVADSGPDEQVRRLWSLIRNTTNTGQHHLSLTPVYMVGEPDPIHLVLKGEWETGVVYAETDVFEIGRPEKK